ncbi:saxitoxin and tetrodotoxin-binding protein 1-like [Chelmon rostratus]|uniref:saxitoxin and tetrodotoxin-binding protein 1-like n=1 Tax=Chelmon rostratus TaxID=109905 RepID=UPI001BE7EE30|nr:saxitoxin and tetrodotoxin-binding protein 1-like [Chelmon rostratus]
MSVLKRAALLLLLLLLAAIGTNADSDHKDCDILKRTLATKDLHKIFGHWALVWSVSQVQYGPDLMTLLSSSKVELRLYPDNNTIMFNENNMFLDKNCAIYFLNMSMPSDPPDSEHHTLHISGGRIESDGVVTHFNESGEGVFYETCSDCLILVYKGSLANYVLSYKRYGHHKDLEQLKSAHGDHQKLAECLGFAHDAPFRFFESTGGGTAALRDVKPADPNKETLCRHFLHIFKMESSGLKLSFWENGPKPGQFYSFPC